MPMWHNVFFRNSKGSKSYYSLHLVRQGVLAQSHIEEGVGLQTDVKLPPTWQPVYQVAIPYLLSLPLQDLPAMWHKPSHKLLAAL